MTTQEERLAYNQRNIDEFRETGGKMPTDFGDAPVLLLSTTGAKSGEPRTAPMMYLADEADPDRVYVFGSNGGRDTDPAWVHNVRADQSVTVEIGTEKLAGTAELLDEPRRSEVYAIQAERYSAFADYEAGTSRAIPVVAVNLQR
jgi:deazaflavin-dependent oxidoreductase (nitroreductase family)